MTMLVTGEILSFKTGMSTSNLWFNNIEQDFVFEAKLFCDYLAINDFFQFKTFIVIKLKQICIISLL